MTWNYRVVNDDGLLGIHEVYYDKGGIAHSMTEHPIAPQGEDLDELRDAFQMMLVALDKPVLPPMGD